MPDLKSKLIRLAYAQPELRRDILSILKEADDKDLITPRSYKARSKDEYDAIMAYSDANRKGGFDEDRNLEFKSDFLPPQQAMDIYKIAIDGSYNEFNARVRKKIMDVVSKYPGTTIAVARESSVAMYIKASQDDRVEMLKTFTDMRIADEINNYPTELRLWWD